MSKKPLIKPFKRFKVTVAELDQFGRQISQEERTFGANGNPELYAKAGQFIRQFSEDHIIEWRKKL